MEEQKKSTNEGISVGNITGATGIAIGHGAQATVTQTTIQSSDVAKAIEVVNQKVAAMPDGPEKGIAQSAVKGLEAEAQKGDKADESTVSKWFNFLAQAAPDAFDVAIATFTNPIAGLGLAFKKIADKAKADKDAKK